MGIENRDYMRERRRRREGGRLGDTSWIDGKGRVEFRPASRIVAHPWQKWIFLLSAASFLIPMYGEAQRKGWLPDFDAAIPFPDSGSVTVAANIERSDVGSKLTVAASDANAVVQLFDPETNRHVLSVYVAGNNRITVPAPTGTFRMRLIEGQKWHGTTRFFGPNTSYETVAELMTFEARRGRIIDLHRRPDGNLPTRLMLTRPGRI
jgi:hypothetical protein